MSSTGIDPDEIGVGDRVDVYYIMHEDSMPTWQYFFSGEVRDDLGGGTFLVHRDETGALKRVSNGATCSVRPEQ